MSAGQSSRQRSQSATSRHANVKPIPPQPTMTPDPDGEFQPCTATASFFLYAQRNVVLCLHHDTLAIERRFDRHREDVLWICADTVSERGAGRLAVSYDAGHTAIVWDISTGDEVARFAAYEHIRVAAWMRNGNIAFGNAQGNVILFEPSTSEHISARTIYDPITAISPAADCRTFAIGFLNGSILIATLQPLFTIVHSLTTSKAPSRISGLGWHGSSSRQKSDMLATQTADGDLRVWSVPKVANTGESPNIIRILSKIEDRMPGPCWFTWSKNGRIIQHADGETRAWDVRTKNVTYQTVPTVDGIVGVACYGPTSTLFTLGRNHTVQQYDVNPNEPPLQVASVQHAPGPIPPSPPNSIEEQKQHQTVDPTVATTTVPLTFAYMDADASEGELGTMSPLDKIVKEMDQLEDERRDLLGELSPTSSRASSVSSKSSNGGRKAPSYRYDKAPSSRASNVSFNEGTEFSFGSPLKHTRESVSIRSTSSFTSSRHRSSGLRKEILRSPDESQQISQMDLFPYTRARLQDVAFRTPHYGQATRTPDVLRREMLSVVFGWNDDIEYLVRDELSRQRPGSASGVLLSKWLGDLGADVMASMIGSESMTSSDWMLLALSSMGPNSQKQVGQAFIQRLLEKGDVHPAVAVLLGLGEHNDAIEVYVSRGYHMEAVLLTCLVMPSDWQRQSYLVRKWGEVAVSRGQPELAVRCFSCTSIDTTEPWSSPRAQDAVFSSQQELGMGPSLLSPPISPPFTAGLNRKIARNASLKLITTFGDKGAPLLLPPDQRTPMNGMLGVGVTPIAESAISPGGAAPWLRSGHKVDRDPSSARTATPGGYRRKRLPSKSGTSRTRDPSQTPLTARRDFANPMKEPEDLEMRPFARSGHSRKASSISSQSFDKLSRQSSESDRLPSPNNEVFARLKQETRNRNGSRERINGELHVQVFDTSYLARGASQGPPMDVEQLDQYSHDNSARASNITTQDRTNALAASRETGGWTRDDGSSEHGSRRNPSEGRGRTNKRYIKPPRGSPSSPIPMSPDEVLASRALVVPDDESYYREVAPTQRKDSTAGQSMRTSSRAPSRQRSPSRDGQRLQPNARARSENRRDGRSPARSPSASLPKARFGREEGAARSDGRGQRSRAASNTEYTQDRTEDIQISLIPRRSIDESSSASEVPEQAVMRRLKPNGLTKKQIAARELEDRRASLARRPSAPAIPLPGDVQLSPRRPNLPPRHHTELGDAPNSSTPPMSGSSIVRSQTADPEAMGRFPFNRNTGTSTSSAPIGLPATPRAMRHPRYMSADPNEREGVPAVPDVPEGLAKLTSAVFQPSAPQSRPTEEDDMAPLLPSTVFGQKIPQSPPRSSSAPPEMSKDGMPSHPAYKATLPHSIRRGSIGRGHSRKITPTESQIANLQPQFSPPSTRGSIDETIHENQVIIIEEEEEDPVTLPELQHLAGPPPPPPPPFVPTPTGQNNNGNNLGVINIAIEEEAPMVIDVMPNLDRTGAITAPPGATNTRRGRGSISEGINSRLRTVTERMRTTSRSRAKSPPVEGYAPSPYETVLPPMFTRQQQPYQQAKSPYESSSSATASDASLSQLQMPPPPPPPPSAPPTLQTQTMLVEHAIPPDNKGFPHPRDMRTHFQPGALLQQGVYQPDNMI